MRKIVWSRTASSHLQRICHFYAEKDKRYAKRLYDDIYVEVERLIEFPQLASIEPLLAEEQKTYRSLVIKKYFKVIYSLDNKQVRIVAVWDCRQNPDYLRRSFEKEKQVKK
ncbi:MAG: type II toxin-antitoxin system RelE/ParE family toxin [Bacteroides sp.]|nr:type II toxin-antitoxin system RelE/ParE family toxin [Bacteroides sp.]